MITRAYIEEVDWKTMKLLVRIPRFDGVDGELGSTSKAELNWASVLCIPGLEIKYKRGDCVVVGFEDNDLGKPIVLGYLGIRGRSMDTPIRGSFESLVVTEEFKAPTNTVIGVTSYALINQVTEEAKT